MKSVFVNAFSDTTSNTLPDVCNDRLSEAPLVVPYFHLHAFPWNEICEMEFPSAGSCLEIFIQKIDFYFLQLPRQSVSDKYIWILIVAINIVI